MSLGDIIAPPGGVGSWQAAAATHTRDEWHAVVDSMRVRYIDFLRSGISCSCGAYILQPSASTATAVINAAAEIDLTKDEDGARGNRRGTTATATASHDQVSAPEVSCPACGSRYCAACGLAPDEELQSQPARAVAVVRRGRTAAAARAPARRKGRQPAAAANEIDLCGSSDEEDSGAPARAGAASSHASRCSLRFVHAIATAVERLRRVHMGTEPAVRDALLKTVAAFRQRMKTSQSVSAHPAESQHKYHHHDPPWSEGDLIPDDHNSDVDDYDDYYGDDEYPPECYCRMCRSLHDLEDDDSSEGCNDGNCEYAPYDNITVPSWSQSAGKRAGAAGPSQRGDEMTMGALALLEADAAAPQQQRNASARRKTSAVGYARGGTGYAGGTGDAKEIRDAEIAQRVRTEARDRVLGPIIRALNDALPRSVLDAAAWGSVETLVHARSGDAKLLLSIETDKASDHPLLLPMLLGPGFRDGMTGPQQPSVARKPVKAAKVKAARGGASTAAAATKKASSAVSAASKKGSTPAATSPAASRKRAAPSPSSAASAAAAAVAGKGDGVHGPSTWHALYCEALRTSIMDMGLSSEPHREVIFALLKTIEALSRHPSLAPALLYTRDDDEVSNTDAASTGRASAAASVITSRCWLYPRHMKVLDSGVAAPPPPSSVAAILRGLQKEATVYTRTSTQGEGTGAPDVLVGDAAEEAEFTAVLCLSRDVEVAAERAEAGLKRWRQQHRAMLMAHLAGIDDLGDATDGRGAVASRAAAQRHSTAGRSGANASLGTAVSRSKPAAPAPRPDEFGLIDPCTTDGSGKVSYVPPAPLIAAYESAMRDGAFDTMDGLAKRHVYAAQSAKAGVAGSMHRMMRVSAEMAALPSLAVHWASSILVRQDKNTMDLMRAAMIGPADTPYANGLFLFDIALPPAYPSIPPNVKFLTTGGGRVRFNPNLYAEGKVCLSLLGTWEGPGWVPDTSTLSQVLLSIQGQILVDEPYFNEPGFEHLRGTVAGKRAVKKHNALLRLGTLRLGIVDAMKNPPPGFEVAARTHFYHKRDEIREQALVWAGEALAMAAYDLKLGVISRARLSTYEASALAEAGSVDEATGANARKAAHAAAVALAAANAEAAAQRSLDAKHGRSSGKGRSQGGGRGSHDTPRAAYPPAIRSFNTSIPARAPTKYPITVRPYSRAIIDAYLSYTSAYYAVLKWSSETTVSGHNPFADGFGAVPAPPSGAIPGPRRHDVDMSPLRADVSVLQQVRARLGAVADIPDWSQQPHSHLALATAQAVDETLHALQAVQPPAVVSASCEAAEDAYNDDLL